MFELTEFVNSDLQKLVVTYFGYVHILGTMTEQVYNFHPVRIVLWVDLRYSNEIAETATLQQFE